MLEDNLFSPDYIVNPGETGNKWPWTSGPITVANHAFTMLHVPREDRRYDGWRDETFNPDAIVLSERNTGANAATRSAASERSRIVASSAAWRTTTTGWNAPRRCAFDTIYGKAANKDDHLFEASGDDDARLIHGGKRDGRGTCVIRRPVSQACPSS